MNGLKECEMIVESEILEALAWLPRTRKQLMIYGRLAGLQRVAADWLTKEALDRLQKSGRVTASEIPLPGERLYKLTAAESDFLGRHSA